MEMPTPCSNCGELFDLLDGKSSPYTLPFGRRVIICATCADKEQAETDRAEEIQNLKDQSPFALKDPGCNSDPFGFALVGILSRIDAARESIAATERNPLAGDEHAIKLMRQDAAKALRALADEIERGEAKK